MSKQKREIKALMTSRGKTMSYVAKKLAMSTQSLSQMLKNGSLRYDLYKKIVDAIGLQVHYQLKD